MAFYGIRSERLPCEQLDHDLPYRWFLDMDMVEERIDHSTFSRNRARLLEHEVAAKFLAEVVAAARAAKLMSDDHFTVDGTLIEAWASAESLRPKGEDPKDWPAPDDPGNPTVNFHGEKRSSQTHESTTDPEARLARKGSNQPARSSDLASAPMENRNGLVVDLRVDTATGCGEREGALALLDQHGDAHEGVTQTRDRRRRSALGGRATRHTGYEVSQRIRKRVEEILGWAKAVGGLRETSFRGKERTQQGVHLVAAAYNLLRMAELMTAPA